VAESEGYGMTPVVLTGADIARLKSDPLFTASHAALLDIMIQAGEVVIETPVESRSQAAPQGARA